MDMAHLRECVRISDGGRIVIPAAFRKALDLKPGDEVILEFSDGEVRLITRDEGIRAAQAILGKHARKGPPVIAELIAEHRQEAERD